MTELLSITGLVIVLLVYELAISHKEHKQLGPAYELNRRAEAVQTILKTNGFKRHKKHHGRTY